MEKLMDGSDSYELAQGDPAGDGRRHLQSSGSRQSL